MKRVVHWSGSEVGQITSANMRQLRQQLREIQLRVPDRVGDRCWSGSRPLAASWGTPEFT